MNAQTATILSGIVLLLVLALVGWNLRRRASHQRKNPGEDGL